MCLDFSGQRCCLTSRILLRRKSALQKIEILGRQIFMTEALFRNII